MQSNFDSILKEDSRRWTRSLRDAAVLFAIVSAAAWYTGLTDFQRLREGVPDLFKLFGEMVPPDFSRVRGWGKPLLATLAMSVAGTALALVFSIPLSLLAARSTSPNRATYAAARATLNLLRAVPELIQGIVFVAAVGFGSLPGVLALGLHSIGMVGKFFAESIENANPAPVEAIRATGAGPLQVVLHGVIPQVWPSWRDVIIYRWEHNFRASTVLGAVGAGGIGTELIGALRILQYREVSAIVLVILVMVTIVDGLGRVIQSRYR